MARMPRMARTPRMARWLADYPDPFATHDLGGITFLKKGNGLCFRRML